MELTVGQTIVKQRAQLEGQDVLLRGLRGCRVFLLGSMAALRLLDVQDCTLCSGPVTGATFVDGAPRQFSWDAGHNLPKLRSCLEACTSEAQH